MTLDEYRVQHGAVTLAEVCRRESERYRGATRISTDMGSVSVSEQALMVDGEECAALDDYSWQMVAKLLDIPIAYMMRMGARMRAGNANYWLSVLRDKDIEFVVKDGELIEMHEGMEIAAGDVLDILSAEMPTGEVVNAFQQSNATVWDIVNPSQLYESECGLFIPGMRVVLKSGLNAPEISPIFMDEGTCAVMECDEFFGKLNIKSLSYNDILHVIGSRVHDCVAYSDSVFRLYRGVECQEVKDAKRRVAQYCREHGVPGRVASYAVSEVESAGLSSSTLGDIIMLFGSLGYRDEVKQSSARKMQRLAGHIVTGSSSESRCTKCDALEIVG